MCSDKFKVSKMGKRMEFLDNGQDANKVLNKLGQMYINSNKGMISMLIILVKRMIRLRLLAVFM